MKYIPSGTRTYGRVVPADHLQAAALVALMRSRGVKRTFVVDDLEAYGDGLARMVRRRATARGIRIAGRRRNPKLRLFAPEGVIERSFARRIPRGAARRTLITNPTLSPGD